MASKLFDLCVACRWNDVMEIIQSQPQEAGKMLDTGKRGAAKISALQVVLAHPKCRGSVPIRVIIALLHAAPHIPAQRHLYTGNFPLHAVFYNAFFSASKRKVIAELITRTYPPSLTLRNNDGRTALHTNCSQHCNYAPVLALLNAAPRTAEMVDNNGDLPLHLACRSQKSPLKSIRVLFDAYPEGIFLRNNWGMRPIDGAKLCALSRVKIEARLEFLENLERVARVVGRRGTMKGGSGVSGGPSPFNRMWSCDENERDDFFREQKNIRKRSRQDYDGEAATGSFFGEALLGLRNCQLTPDKAVKRESFLTEKRSPVEDAHGSQDDEIRQGHFMARPKPPLIDLDCAEILVSMSHCVKR